MILRNLLAIKVLALSFLMTFSFSAQAAGGSGEKFEPSEMILHHIADDYQWHFFTIPGEHGETHVSIYLPVILYTNGQLDIFLSSEFHHQEAAAEDHGEHHAPGVKRGDITYTLSHGHIAATDAAGNELHPLDFSITKNVVSLFISAILLLLVFTSVARGFKKNEGKAPKGIQSFFEPIIIYVRDEIALPNIGEKHYRRFVPYLLTLFFFIWFNNLLGLIPTGANMSGNIAFTAVLAILSLFIINFNGKKDYWLHIFWTPGVPKWILPIMMPVELAGIFIKPVALCIRLFANITAGHIIILSLLSFIFVFQSAYVGIPAGAFVIVMMMLELFVAILQAYIFTLLTALFIGQAVEEHDHH